MECNKDEAVRARDVAEKKMQLKDFIGAKKFASKAQQLFPDLDGITQMLAVCEVHCAAELKINGTDDFYNILQVQPLADEPLIKKQYRKLALLLHPDKNKFPGAEAAFKLVGEANRILTDQSKRSLYDIKRNTSLRSVKTKPAAQHTNTASFPNGQHMKNQFQNVQFHSVNSELPPQTHTATTFWTSCPFCRIRYQYFRTIMNRSLRCQNCMKPFVAYELNSNTAPSGVPAYPHTKGSSGQHAHDNSHQYNHNNVGARSTASQPSQHVGVKVNQVHISGIGKEDVRGGTDGMVNDVKYEKVNLDINRKGGYVAKTSGNQNKKRNRNAVESSDSESKKDGFCVKKNMKGNNSQRSNIQMQNATCAVGGSDPDEADAVIPGVEASSHVNADVCDAVPRECNCPDTEFYDFDQKRNADLFAVGQIWALYDDLDGMPRFYARIKNVVTPGFKVRFTWLEHDPNRQPEIDWSEKALPVGSGNFKLGSSQTSEDLPMFSHLMLWDKGHRKKTVRIHPRRNEIWALFKGWDMKWAYESDVRKSYEYEIVEIISDDTDGAVSVMPLVKVEGFVSVFARPACEPAILFIKSDENLRFSHMIPSHQLSGCEREGIPVGSYELDSASLPADFEKVYPSVSYRAESKVGSKDDIKSSSVDLDADMKSTNCCPTSNQSQEMPNIHETINLRSSYDRGANTEEKLSDDTDVTEDVDSSINKERKGNGDAPLYPKNLSYEYPEPEFHNFGSERSFEKIQSGQIWALYSDVDGFPKYYALIKEVDVNDSKICLSWLEGCPLQEDDVKWADKELPLSSGLFKVLRGKNGLGAYDSLEAFSHLVSAKPSIRKHQYEIYPRVGEIWALYRNWTSEWDESDLCNCEFDIVEILNTNSSVEVLYLSKVEGYNSVFQPKRVNEVLAKAEISRDRLLQFSHLIPSFRMTEEREGKLRGCWELDPAAVPELILCS